MLVSRASLGTLHVPCSLSHYLLSLSQLGLLSLPLTPLCSPYPPPFPHSMLSFLTSTAVTLALHRFTGAAFNAAVSAALASSALPILVAEGWPAYWPGTCRSRTCYSRLARYIHSIGSLGQPGHANDVSRQRHQEPGGG